MTIKRYALSGNITPWGQMFLREMEHEDGVYCHWKDVEPIILANEGYRELVRIRREENDFLRAKLAVYEAIPTSECARKAIDERIATAEVKS